MTERKKESIFDFALRVGGANCRDGDGSGYKCDLAPSPPNKSRRLKFFKSYCRICVLVVDTQIGRCVMGDNTQKRARCMNVKKLCCH